MEECGDHSGRTLVAQPRTPGFNFQQLLAFHFQFSPHNINHFSVQACVLLYWPVDVFNYCRVLPSNQLPWVLTKVGVGPLPTLRLLRLSLRQLQWRPPASFRDWRWAYRMSLWCHCNVTVMSFECHCDVTVMSLWCHCDVTVMLLGIHMFSRTGKVFIYHAGKCTGVIEKTLQVFFSFFTASLMRIHIRNYMYKSYIV